MIEGIGDGLWLMQAEKETASNLQQSHISEPPTL